MKDLFSDLDLNRDGRLNKRELENAFRSLRMGVSADEIDQLFIRYDADRSGDIDYKEFLAILDYIPPSQQMDSSEALIVKLRQKIEDRMGSLSSGKGRLKEIFGDMDNNGDGKLSQRELYDGLERLRIGFSHADVGIIFGSVDRDRSGAIDYEVLSFIYSFIHLFIYSFIHLFIHSSLFSFKCLTNTVHHSNL